jgi:hypothetical protein
VRITQLAGVGFSVLFGYPFVLDGFRSYREREREGERERERERRERERDRYRYAKSSFLKNLSLSIYI